MMWILRHRQPLSSILCRTEGGRKHFIGSFQKSYIWHIRIGQLGSGKIDTIFTQATSMNRLRCKTHYFTLSPPFFNIQRSNYVKSERQTPSSSNLLH